MTYYLIISNLLSFNVHFTTNWWLEHVSQGQYAITLSLCKNEVIFMLFNVRGLGQKIKREQIFTHLHTKQFNVCFLQETHSTKDVETARAANSPYNFYFSGRSSSSSGICIMIDKQTDYDFVEHIEIIPGKIQALKVKMYERNVVFINVYGPNADDKTFFELLCNF